MPKQIESSDLKLLKWAVLAITIVAVIATALYLRRDSIARGIANSMLGEQDLVVTELLVDRLAADRLELAELIVESDSGTTYAISGLSLPLALQGEDVSKIAAERVIVTFDTERTERSLLSESLQTALDFPLIRPNLEVSVAYLSLPNFPELSDVAWATSENGQDLVFSIETLRIVVGVTRNDEQNHSALISATDGDGDEVLIADITLARRDGTYGVSGDARLSTSAWLPLMRSLHLLPAGLGGLDAKLQGPIEVVIDDQEAGRVSFQARLALTDELAAAYVMTSGLTTDVRATSLDGFSFDLEYPSFEWIARAESVETLVWTDGFEDLPVHISGLECRSGGRCGMRASVDTQDIEWNGYDVGRAEISLPMRIEFEEVTRIDISADATATFSGVHASDVAARSIDVVAFSGTQLVITDDAWSCGIDQLRLAVGGFSSAGNLVASVPVTFTGLNIQDSAGTVDTRVLLTPETGASWDDMAVNLPAAEGTLSIRNNRLTAALDLAGGSDTLSAKVELIHDLSTDKRSLSVENAQVSFDRAGMSAFAPDWPYAWDVVGGTWQAQMNIEWQTEGADTEYHGTMQHKLQALAGKYNDMAFIGLSTDVAATVDSDDGIGVAPSSIVVRLLDIGLPVEQIAADYAVDVDKRTVDVRDFSATALGGKFVADPFRLSATDEPNLVTLRARSVQLQLMADLAEFEDLQVSGKVSGVLPVTVRGKGITIANGRLESEPPGGVIRYDSGDAPPDAVVADDGFNFAMWLLSNFEYESLSSDVNYTEAGDLKLQMRLSGVNPDTDATQPIILNLGVENNVPQMLRSLRAIRSIEDILERRTAK
jgi:hypothetical protein